VHTYSSFFWFLPTEEEVAAIGESMETRYTDIIIYASGFLALIMAVVIVVLCRMQVHPSREPFDVLPVQKLSKFPLRRQVNARQTPSEGRGIIGASLFSS
jgi:cadherin 2 type 1 (N-cadherin)